METDKGIFRAAAATTLAIAGASATMYLFAAAVTSKRSASNSSKKKKEDSIYIRLNDFEEMALARGSAPISTMTWFSGDHHQAASVIRERVMLVVRANPWLLGQFVTLEDGMNYIAYKKNIQVEHEPLDISTVFTHYSADALNIRRDTPFEELAVSSSNMLLKSYKDREQQFWKVSVIPCAESPNTTFGVTVSMSHVVGDGHTFYALYNMIIGGEPIRSLKATRIMETTDLQKTAMGLSEQGFMGSPGFILCAIRGLFYQNIWSRFKGGQHGQSRYFLVDMDALRELKEQATATAAASEDSVPFCSSNDVISSWYMINCGCNTSIMAINFRNRLPGHTDEHAGNYENLLYYRKQDSAAPALIRKSLSTLKRTVTDKEPISTLEVGLGCIAFCSNWASFISDRVELPGCTQQVHLPIYNWAEALPSTMAVGTIFQPNPGQLAVSIGAIPELLRGLESAPFEATTAFK
jgi:hypothetical protein